MTRKHKVNAVVTVEISLYVLNADDMEQAAEQAAEGALKALPKSRSAKIVDLSGQFNEVLRFRK